MCNSYNLLYQIYDILYENIILIEFEAVHCKARATCRTCSFTVISSSNRLTSSSNNCMSYQQFLSMRQKKHQPKNLSEK